MDLSQADVWVFTFEVKKHTTGSVGFAVHALSLSRGCMELTSD